ncbi:MAG TPA: amino acid permease C-terminal domain-containing protein, partial [Rhodanobacter sp.]
SSHWYQWLLLGIWTVLGMAIYFGYGRRHSQLRKLPSA